MAQESLTSSLSTVTMALCVIVSLVLLQCVQISCEYDNSDSSEKQFPSCLPSNTQCQSDPLGFEAIAQLHTLIDDDHNGNLDREESDGFFRDELKHEDVTARQQTFHGADDFITVHDLWTLWTLSEVYNWTTDNVITWLEEEVSLPKYTEAFRVNAVDGHILPRLAVNGHYVTNILGIKNGVHRQKLAIKATDVVLFGIKKKGHNLVKDCLLVLFLGLALILAWMGHKQNKTSQLHVRKIMDKLENLQKSDDDMKLLRRRDEMQNEKVTEEHRRIKEEKTMIEQKLQGEIIKAKDEAERLREAREATEEEISSLKLAELELVEVRKALSDAEQRCEQLTSGIPPLVELQQWLQLSYEIETQHYEAKREAAERQLRVAREMCEKIHKKRMGLLGSLRVAHSTSLDDTDHSIMQARGALEEVKLHLMERNHRWQEIENLCGFDIIRNPGLHVLETSLRGIGSTFLAGNNMSRSPSMSTFSTASTLPIESELDEDLTAGHLATAGVPSRQYPDRRVWPNLMKAGMQLTMFGLGLTNPNLGGGPQPPMDHHHGDRRSLAQLMQHRASPSLASGMLAPGRHVKSAASTSQLRAVSVANGGNQAAATLANGGNHGNHSSDHSLDVKFSLGDEGSASEKETTAPQPAGCKKSQSLDASATTAGPKKSLSNSHSESSLQGLASKLQSSNIPVRRPPRSPETPPVVLEEGSSTGASSESLNTAGTSKDKVKKKSSLKNLFRGKLKMKDC